MRRPLVHLPCLPVAGLGAMPPPSSLAGIPVATGPLPSETGPLPGANSHPAHSVAAGSLPVASLLGASGDLSADARSSPSVAATMCNLLSIGGDGHAAKLPGLYVGEGLPPVPVKLVEKIHKWEFVDMAELLPEYWGTVHSSRVEAELTQGNHRLVSKKKVTDILTWVQCFAVYTSVMASRNPEAVPELLAYLVCILRTSQDFGGLAWVNYDSAFRRQAAATGNRQWSRVNPSLYSICFAGVARASVRCDLCLSLNHRSKDCAMIAEADPDVGSRLKAVESAVLALTQPRWPVHNSAGPPGGASSEACRNFNKGRCSFRWCRYRHACRVCGGPQPASECCEKTHLRGPMSAVLQGGGQAQMSWPKRPRDGPRPY